eukprot:511405-Amphidinium_carterae.1
MNWPPCKPKKQQTLPLRDQGQAAGQADHPWSFRAGGNSQSSGCRSGHVGATPEFSHDCAEGGDAEALTLIEKDDLELKSQIGGTQTTESHTQCGVHHRLGCRRFELFKKSCQTPELSLLERNRLWCTTGIIGQTSTRRVPSGWEMALDLALLGIHCTQAALDGNFKSARVGSCGFLLTVAVVGIG